MTMASPSALARLRSASASAPMPPSEPPESKPRCSASQPTMGAPQAAIAPVGGPAGRWECLGAEKRYLAAIVQESCLAGCPALPLPTHLQRHGQTSRQATSAGRAPPLQRRAMCRRCRPSCGGGTRGGGRVEVGAFVGGHGAYLDRRRLVNCAVLPRRAGNPGGRDCSAQAA